MFTLYAVVRNCCTSGNCFSCSGITPFGTPRRVEHWRGEDQRTAEVLAQNWKAYGAEVTDQPELRSMDGMALALYNDQTGTSRELAIPPGLTWSEAVAWAEQYRADFERIGDTFQYA